MRTRFADSTSSGKRVVANFWFGVALPSSNWFGHGRRRSYRSGLDQCASSIGKCPTCSAVERSLLSRSRRPRPLAALRSWISDPDDQPEKWLRSGAPAGLASLQLTRGVYVFTNYPGIDQDEVAQLEVTDLHRRGLLEAFDSIEDVRNYLGQKPVLSKVGVRTKIVGDKIKKRVIVDSYRSGVSDSTTKPERSVLPRVLDAVDDFMVQRQSANQESSTDFVVLDFTRALFIIPLAWEERRFFVIRLRGKFFVFKVCAQGAAASPLVWARTAALVSRLTQYMFLQTELAIEVFVDDPCLAVTGCLAQRNKNIAIVLLFWRTLGFPLLFKKGQKGPIVKWIGFTLRSTNTELEISIKPEILSELCSQIASAVKCNVISKKDLQRLAGRANFVAGMIPVWRPFLQELWGALAGDGGNAPPNCSWTSQIKSVLTWLDLFLSGVRGTLVRTFSLDPWSSVAKPILITLDASPWSLGGIIEVQGNIVSFFSSPLSHLDSQILGHTIGEASGQQVWESLSALVALRAWKSYWTKDRAKVILCPCLPWFCASNRHVRLALVCLREKWLWILQRVPTSQTSQQCTLGASQISLPICFREKQPLVAQALDHWFFNSLQKL